MRMALQNGIAPIGSRYIPPTVLFQRFPFHFVSHRTGWDLSMCIQPLRFTSPGSPLIVSIHPSSHQSYPLNTEMVLFRWFPGSILRVACRRACILLSLPPAFYSILRSTELVAPLNSIFSFWFSYNLRKDLPASPCPSICSSVCFHVIDAPVFLWHSSAWYIITQWWALAWYTLSVLINVSF